MATLFFSLIFTAAAAPHDWHHGPPGYHHEGNAYKHVVAISVDGMHGSDVTKWVALSPNSNISKLLQTGYEYTDAWTSAPSDSFPGSLAQFTGATPKTTGPVPKVFVYDETNDYDPTQLFSGGIDPANLPQAFVDGKCQEIYPHQRLRVNTIFEVVHSNGLQTAYADKHPAYDLVRGPSGTGLTVGYFPEIAAVANTVAATIAYDQLHVDAWLDWIKAATPVNTTVFDGPLTTTPALFGGNFQALSVAQKTVGYNNDSQSSFSPAIVRAMSFVDASIGAVVNELAATGLLEDTLIVVASKHGQAPIDRHLYGTVDPQLITNLTGVPVAFQTSDDIALIFLENAADTATATANLRAHAAEGKIRSVIWGANLTASGFGDPATDPAVPNIIVQPELGIIYTNSHAKVAEHGGLSSDDRQVACFVSNPRLRKQVFDERVATTQVAPTVLHALGIQTSLLQGAVQEGTQILPGFW
ncbi:hypothetical protein B0A48_00912 [Cryoendolithus antarcticus]|uniref:Type I phosphodiesterase/nucleotide pyrophosphatase n=1 Tax=Cryoendolithus antarcticus TaxID=1507870 RepID=A0A1V8TRQ5_9PEZI|nr:hypothetical protein B0A48_00912 [Cryoendolithus antarcticus]